MTTPLTPEQQAFATEHHGLLMAFMKRHSLDDDYYGPLSNRYLNAVVRYLTEPELQKYAFSTVVWYHLRSELSNIARRMEKQIQALPIELNGEVPVYDEAPIDAALWEKVEEVLTYKQCEAVYLRNQGYTNREIADLCGISRKAVEKRFTRIRRILNDFKEF